jgi:hypothetical protein
MNTKANFLTHSVNPTAEKVIVVTKITLTLNANKAFGIPKSSMRHVAVVNAIDVKQKNRRKLRSIVLNLRSGGEKGFEMPSHKTWNWAFT